MSNNNIQITLPPNCGDAGFLTAIENAEKNQQVITSLHLSPSSSKITEAGFISILQNKKEQLSSSLQELDLEFFDRLTDGGIKAIGENLAALKSLNLSGCSNFTKEGIQKYLVDNNSSLLQNLTCLDFSGQIYESRSAHGAGGLNMTEVLILLCDSLKKITHLNLSSCFGIDPSAFHHLSKLSSTLLSLNLVNCNNVINDDHFLDTNSSSLCSLVNLTELNIGMTEVTDKSMKNISQSFTKLIRFSPPMELTDEGLQHLVGPESKLTQLQELDCAGFDNITGTGFANSTKLTKLSRLLLDDCPNFSDEGLENVANSGFSSSLTELRLHCGKITDAGAQSIAKLSNLSNLNLRHATNLSDAGLLAIASSLGASALTQIGFSRLNKTSVTETGLIQFISKTTKLTKLYFWRCPSVSDNVVLKIASTLSRTLKELDFSDCTGITDNASKNLALLPSAFTKLGFPVCNNISDATLENLCSSPFLQNSLVELDLALSEEISGDAIVENIPKLKKLKSLSCFMINKNDLKRLKSLAPNLENVNVDDEDEDEDCECGGYEDDDDDDE